MQKAAIWAELARITAALKPAAAKVLTWLTAEALSNGSVSARASCRAIAAGTGCNKSKTIPATKDLVTLRLIAKREGTATRSAAYILRYAETLRMGGPLKGPPVESFPQNPGDQGGRFKGPPCEGDLQHCGTLFDLDPGVLSIDSRFSSVASSSIDRSGDLPEAQLNDAHRDECRALMLYFVKHQLRWNDPHPPDKKILSVMLRVAEWPAIENFLVTMIKKRDCRIPQNIGAPYAWLVAVAINQIHGIAADEQKPTLELLRGGKQMYTKWHTEGLK